MKLGTFTNHFPFRPGTAHTPWAHGNPLPGPRVITHRGGTCPAPLARSPAAEGGWAEKTGPGLDSPQVHSLKPTAPHAPPCPSPFARLPSRTPVHSPLPTEAQHLPHSHSAADLASCFAQTADTCWKERKKQPPIPPGHPPTHSPLTFPTHRGPVYGDPPSPGSHPAYAHTHVHRGVHTHIPSPILKSFRSHHLSPQLWLPVLLPFASRFHQQAVRNWLFSPKWPHSDFLHRSPNTTSAWAMVAAMLLRLAVGSQSCRICPSVSCSGHS